MRHATRLRGVLCLSAQASDRLRQFNRNEDGSVTIFAVFLFLIIFVLTGIGIDTMRHETTRVRLQASVDSATLAAADLEQSLDPTAVVENYLEVTKLASFIDYINVDETFHSREVSSAISGSMPTSFMHMSGVDALSVAAGATAFEQAPDREISLVLDISGSMSSTASSSAYSREYLMRLAATKFVENTLSRNSDSTGAEAPYKTTISVVPFAGQTNPGSTMFEYLGGERFGTTTEQGPSGDGYFPTWEQDISNIVFWFDTDDDGTVDHSVKIEGYDAYESVTLPEFNQNDLDEYYLYVTDFIETQDPSLAGKIELVGATIKGGKQPTTYYSLVGEESGPTDFKNTDMELQFNDFYTYVQSIPNHTSSCLEMTYDDFFDSTLPSGSIEQTPYFVNWDYDETTENWGWCPDDNNAILYAQDDIAALSAYINELDLFDGTGTNYSLKYALALLDPSSRTAFAHLASLGEIPSEYAIRPLNWGEAKSSKYIVLMTDGLVSPQVRPTDELDEINGSTELTERPSTDSVETSSQLDNLDLFLTQCELAKANGVIIYTIAFETSEIVASEIGSCASSPSHAYTATGEEVIDSFVSIASSIRQLRLIR